MVSCRSEQHRHRPKRTKISNISSIQHADLGVPNSLFQGLSEYAPHPPPLRDTQWTQMRPLKTLHVGTNGNDAKRCLSRATLTAPHNLFTHF